MGDITLQPFKELQGAIHTLLTGGGSPISIQMYDEVEKTPTFPYGTYGEVEDSPMEARGVNGRNVLFPINIFSRDQSPGGKYEIYAIMDEIIAKINAGKISMTNFAEIQKTHTTPKVTRLEKEPGVSYRGTIVWLITVAKKT